MGGDRVIRFNYLTSPAERLFGRPLPALRPGALHARVAWLALAFVVVAAAWCVQELRFHELHRRGAALADRIAAREIDLRRLRVLDADVVRLRTLNASIARVRRSGSAQANAIAAIGNELPADAWLTSLRFVSSGTTIEGRGSRLGAVATTLTRLSRLDRVATVRLLAVHADPSRADVTYAIELERRR